MSMRRRFLQRQLARIPQRPRQVKLDRKELSGYHPTDQNIREYEANALLEELEALDDEQ